MNNNESLFFVENNFTFIDPDKLNKISKRFWKYEELVVKVFRIKENDLEENLKVCLINMLNIQDNHFQKIFGFTQKNEKTYVVFEKIIGVPLSQTLQKKNFCEKLSLMKTILLILNEFLTQDRFLSCLSSTSIVIMENNNIKFKYFQNFRRNFLNKNYARRFDFKESNYINPDEFDVQEDDGDSNYELYYKNMKTNGMIFLLGCLISEAFSGVEPWSQLAKNRTSVENLIANRRNFPIPIQISEPILYEIIEKCTSYEPGERLSIIEISQMIGKIVYEMHFLIFCIKKSKDLLKFQHQKSILLKINKFITKPSFDKI